LLWYFALLAFIPLQLEGYVMIFVPALSDVAVGKSMVHAGESKTSTTARRPRTHGEPASR